MYGRFHGDIDNHLSVLESYVNAQVAFENSNRHGQLVCDANLYDAIHGTLEVDIASGPLSNVVAQSINASGRMGTGENIPNWSFVNNHDQEHNVAAVIPVPTLKQGGATPGTALYRSKQSASF